MAVLPNRLPIVSPRDRTATHRRTRLTVVIVNFCQWRNTARLVRQLRHALAVRDAETQIVIVDNGSPDHVLSARLGKIRGVTLLRNRRNLGFAKAVNRGVLACVSDWILLLNPDVTVEDGFLDQTLALIDELPVGMKVGAVGLQLRHADGSPQASVGRFPTFLRTLTGLLRPRERRKCQHQSHVERDPVDWATGGCLIVNRDCFRDLGGLDERFFLYYEDVDFCRRAANRGWQVLYDPRAGVTHHWPLHCREVPAPLRLITRHALLTYAQLHWAKLPALMLAKMIGLEALMRQLHARFHGKTETAETYHELCRLVVFIRHGQHAAIGRSIESAATSLRAIAAMQDHRDDE